VEHPKPHPAMLIRAWHLSPDWVSSLAEAVTEIGGSRIRAVFKSSQLQQSEEIQT